jgi:hypothetical protein
MHYEAKPLPVPQIQQTPREDEPAPSYAFGASLADAQKPSSSSPNTPPNSTPGFPQSVVANTAKAPIR